MLSVLHQIHLTGICGEYGIEFKDLGIGTADSLLVTVGHPHSTVIEVHALRLIPGGHECTDDQK